MNDIPLSILFLMLGISILLSAFFSSSETSMMALNRYRLRHQTKDKNPAALRVAKLLQRQDRLIGLILLGNNLVNIIAATIATLIGLRLGGDLGVALAPFILVIVFLIFAEVIPKTVAAMHPEGIAFPASLPLTLLMKLLYPAVYVVNRASNSILTLFSLDPEQTSDQSLSREELHSIVHGARHQIPKNHQRMLMNILELEDITVEDVMVPRNKINMVDIQDSTQQIMEYVANARHACLPVYDDDVDNIIGILHLRRLLRHSPLNNRETSATGLPEDTLSEPYFVAKSTSLQQQLLNFQQQKEYLGLVVDEYGTVQGLLTMTDILEEIVGKFIINLQDYGQNMQQEPDGTWLIDGSTTLREINRHLQWKLPSGKSKTLNGLIMEHLEQIPSSGISLRIDDYTLEVTKVANKAVKKARIKKDKKEEPDETD